MDFISKPYKTENSKRTKHEDVHFFKFLNNFGALLAKIPDEDRYEFCLIYYIDEDDNWQPIRSDGEDVKGTIDEKNVNKVLKEISKMPEV